MANSVEPDQLASALFAKAGYSWVQQNKGLLRVNMSLDKNSKKVARNL